MKVRAAENADIPVLLELCRESHQASTLSGFTFNDEKAQRYLDSAISKQELSNCLLIAEDGENIVGLLSGRLREYFFSNLFKAVSHFFYIKPDYYNSPATAELIYAFFIWAEQRGAVEMLISESANIKRDHDMETFKSLGFQHVGGNYFMLLGG
jgi:hypothetical protein